ncbi:MAG: hypothetical protein RL441_356 [Actinomycetota bacterium]|jgi:hypothetical protein
MTRFGSEILSSDFPDDDGSANPELLAALHLHLRARTELTEAAIITSLRESRLLVPVVARVDEVDERGADKDSHIAAVTFQSRDGRVGLPAFTSLETLKQWDPEARPVPQKAVLVAASCLEQGLDALLIDMASEHRHALTADALKRLLA